MVVLTAETCWALNEYWINNKISGIKLVFSLLNSRAVICVGAKCFIMQTTRSLENELSGQHTDWQTDLSRHLETKFNLISKLLRVDTISNDFIWSSKFIISESEKSIKIHYQTIARNSLNHTVLTNVYLTRLFPPLLSPHHPTFTLRVHQRCDITLSTSLLLASISRHNSWGSQSMKGFMSKSDGTGYAGILGLKGAVLYFSTWRLLFLHNNLILY